MTRFGCALMLAIVVSMAGPQTPPQNRAHGIIPLKSTRPDVERLLGIPNGYCTEESSSDYKCPDEGVTVRYSNGNCEGGWIVQQDTVLNVKVSPKERLEFTDLGLDLTRYEKSQPEHDVPDRIDYRDSAHGLTISVRSDIVYEYTFGPTLADDCLSCERPRVETPPFNPDCLHLTLMVDCRSEALKLGSTVECKAKIGSTPENFERIFEWKISNGAVFTRKGVDTVLVDLTDPTVKSVTLSVKVISPLLCFDSAQMEFKIAKNPY
jgi:hypothetical protein